MGYMVNLTFADTVLKSNKLHSCINYSCYWLFFLFVTAPGFLDSPMAQPARVGPPTRAPPPLPPENNTPSPPGLPPRETGTRVIKHSVSKFVIWTIKTLSWFLLFWNEIDLKLFLSCFVFLIFISFMLFTKKHSLKYDFAPLLKVM